MTLKQGAYILCGYGGVGKSSLTHRLKRSQEILIDMDSGAYSKHPQFPKNYLDALRQIMEHSAKKPWVLCSTHLAWLEILKQQGYYYVLVCPDQSVSAETWEKERYLNRDNPEGYIEAMRANYDRYLTDMYQHAENNPQCLLLTLKAGEYLSDVFPTIRSWYQQLEAKK